MNLFSISMIATNSLIDPQNISPWENHSQHQNFLELSQLLEEQDSLPSESLNSPLYLKDQNFLLDVIVARQVPVQLKLKVKQEKLPKPKNKPQKNQNNDHNQSSVHSQEPFNNIVGSNSQFNLVENTISREKTCVKKPKLKNKKKPKKQHYFKQQKHPDTQAKLLRKSTTIGCLFSQKTQVQSIIQQSNNLIVRQESQESQAKQREAKNSFKYSQKPTINYPILSKIHTENSSKNMTRRGFQSQEETSTCSPSKNQKIPKLHTLRLSDCQKDRNNTYEKAFLKPRNQMKSLKEFFKKSHLIPSQAAICFSKKCSTQYEKYQENFLLDNKPLEHEGQNKRFNENLDQKGKKENTQQSFIGPEAVSSVLNKHEHKIVLTEHIRMKSKKQQTTENRKTSPQQAIIGQNKRTERRSRQKASLTIFELKNQDLGFCKKHKLQKMQQPSKLGNKQNSPLLCPKDTSQLGQKQRPIDFTTLCATQKQKLHQLSYQTNHKQDPTKIYHLKKASIGSLPKIEAFYQNESQSKVRRVFQTSKVFFYAGDQNVYVNS